MATNNTKTLFWTRAGDGYYTCHETSPPVQKKINVINGSILCVPPTSLPSFLDSMVDDRTAVLTMDPSLFPNINSLDEMEGKSLSTLVVDGYRSEWVAQIMRTDYKHVVVVMSDIHLLTYALVTLISRLFRITGFGIVADPLSLEYFLTETLVYRREVPPLVQVKFGYVLILRDRHTTLRLRLPKRSPSWSPWRA